MAEFLKSADLSSVELLVEIGLEEIPARMIAAAQAELAKRVAELLTRERLTAESFSIKSYSTPRRLAVLASGVALAQADTEERLIGPAWSIAFKDGTASPAAHAFSKKAGVSIEALEKVVTPKGEYLTAVVLRPGRAAADLLSGELAKEIGALSWPKSMYWRAGKPERYVRPVKWLLALLDHAILPIEFAGVHAANLSYGHRALHGSRAVTMNHPAEYVSALEGAKVLVEVVARRQKIRKALDRVTRTLHGARWREDEALVESVVHMTEWPSVVLGDFEHEFLALPQEILVTVMRDHQKYFAVEDEEGKLAPHFLAVLNTEPDAGGLIQHGNERVLRARFNDARFFWNFDQNISLEDRVELLKAVTFQKDLGSYHEKMRRTLAIAKHLTKKVGAGADASALERAVRFAKVDLTTELVKEFPELQGIVGGLYARAAGESEKITQAIYSQYQPASMADAIPLTPEGQLLGLAERIGTIADMFRLGLAPSGSKDPYALRRAGNAIVRILIESRLPLTLDDLYAAVEEGEQGVAGAQTLVHPFFLERLEFYLREVLQLSFDVVRAVLCAPGIGDLKGVVSRAHAVAAVRNSEDFAAIAAALKRSKNILRQAQEKGQQPAAQVQPELLSDPAEQALYKAASTVGPAMEELRQQGDYAASLAEIATLRPHVDLFFDQVMVMSEEEALRANRLALLNRIVGELSRIADFSEIVTTIVTAGVS